MKSVVSEKGQVTLPKKLRTRLGIRPGQILDFHEEKGRLVASKAVTQDAIDSVYGILKLPCSTDKMVTALRGKAGPA